MMEEVIRFYDEQITKYTAIRQRLKRRMYHVGTLRLFLFVTALIILWFFRETGWMTLTAWTTAFALPFVALLVYHTKLSEKKAYAEGMIRLNTDEKKALNYDFSAFEGAPEQIDTQHPFTLDLDVFGTQSLFQSINRTVTSIGQSCLAEWFMYPLEEKGEILIRQQAVRELTGKVAFRQDFYVTGITCKGHHDDLTQLKTLTGQAAEASSFGAVWRAMLWLVPSAWLAIIAGIGFGWLPVWTAGAMVALGFLIANLPGRKIHQLCRSIDKMEQLLRAYSQLIGKIERETFDAPLLTSLQQHFVSEKTSASRAIRRMSRIIGALDQRYSTIGIILNLLYLRDMRQVMLMEQWLRTHSTHFGLWFEALAQTDALCSLGGFAFNHPDYPYPAIAETYFVMEGEALGHPLLHREKCIRNDVCISKHPYFMVVTGANMAGKSTYLRTIGVNFLLACMGMPVCARSLTVYPARPVTSLRTADSLAANESYFFAELKRLKMIIDRLNAGEKLFIILDEILKGTNSKDKQKGSLALMKQLIAKEACGIIATHDLLLGTLEDEFPHDIKNYRFEADITDNTLTFSYRMREGVARNMNASFLMKKMGITLSE